MDGLGSEDPRWIGEYRLLSKLGAGGMGQVYLARSERGRTVAVKLVQRELAEQTEFRRRFRQEVEAARRVGGEWTAPVLDADTEAATPWVATGYIAGPSLHAVVAREFGPLPERSVRLLAGGLARALRDIHSAGLIHRDLKPSNVLVTIDGPRVIDFGIARALETVTDGMLTRTGAVVGSPGFMSPEQVRGERVTPASDVFCLGSVLAFAATGHTPFGTADSGVHALMYRIAQEDPDLEGLPEQLRELVANCLAKSPGDRPSVEDLLERTDAEATITDSVNAQPWLPGALVAQLGRHAVQLLDSEDPEFDAAPPPRPSSPPRPAAPPPPAVPPPPRTPAPPALPSAPPPPSTPAPAGAEPVPPPGPGADRPGQPVDPRLGPAADPRAEPPAAEPRDAVPPAAVSHDAEARDPAPQDAAPQAAEPQDAVPPAAEPRNAELRNAAPAGSPTAGAEPPTPVAPRDPVPEGATPVQPLTPTPTQAAHAAAPTATGPSTPTPFPSLAPVGGGPAPVPPPAGNSQRTRTILLVLAVVVAVLALSGTATYLIASSGGGGDDKPPTSAGGEPSVSAEESEPEPEPTVPTTDVPTAEGTTPPVGDVPEEYLGVWEGQVKDSSGDDAGIFRRMEIVQGPTGSVVATTTNLHSQLLCQGEATLVSFSTLMVIESEITSSVPEDECSAYDTQTLKLQDDGTLVWTYDDDGLRAEMTRNTTPETEPIPESFIGTWQGTGVPDEESPEANMQYVINVEQGEPGTVVSTWTGDSDSWHCEWESTLVSVTDGGKTVLLGPGKVLVSEPADVCEDGETYALTLRMKGTDQVSAQSVGDDTTPVTYTRTR